MCFEIRAPSSTSPPSLRRISNLLTCPPRTPTEGISTEEDLYNREYRTPLSNNNLQRGKHNHHLNKRGRPLPKQPQSTSPRGSKQQPQPLPKREHPTIQIKLYQRGIQQMKGFTTRWYLSTTNNLFSHK